MSNFLGFIKEDVEAKKSLISTLPINTKANRTAFNEKIESFIEKYNGYKDSVKKYIDVKSNSFAIGEEKDNSGLTKTISDLDYVRLIMNPSNTYFEKLGFDSLFYKISNCRDLKFEDLNKLLEEFLNKFELAGIKYSIEDFDYTCYVYEYMNAFLEVRSASSIDYSRVLETFEKIYWINPEIIQHIELCFKKMIRKNEKTFIEYIERVKKDITLNQGFADYESVLEKLRTNYNALEVASRESVSEIIDLALKGQIDVNQYFADSKIRMSTYDDLMVNAADIGNKELMDKFYRNIEKLCINLKEYGKYLKSIPLIDGFREEYKKYLANESNDSAKELKEIENQILEKESALAKINKNVFETKKIFPDFRGNRDVNKNRLDSIKCAKELYELYKEYDNKYFIDKVLSVLHSSFTVADWLHLYYSFDYFKKLAISRVFGIDNYELIEKNSSEFDDFAKDVTNVIVNGVLLFEDANVARIVVNKYRLNDIKIEENSLTAEGLELLMDKLKMPLRIKSIEESETSFERIWFMVKVDRINASINKNS